MRILFSFGSPKEVPKDDQEKNKTETPSLPSVDLLDSASVLIPAFFILLLCSYFEGATGDVIELEDDGPVTINTPITFTVKNFYKTINPSYEYRLAFTEFPELDKTIISNDSEITYKIIFTSPKAKEGYYDVYLQVWYCASGAPAHLISNVLSSFYLLESLVGCIYVTQNIERISLENWIISTALPVNLTAEIYDPTGFLTQPT
ncbi:uncharacterized protein LOC107362157 isoform X2 [Tetranychus urticae]|uniref:uncharacterized protein LOC107362157 isoform X2 n=1 Tax=Tetranychus urticae TaxID=32264 RepID=UPI00077BD137|nr:uncharacterized protein LOC107362157 isoform X2 [Tetranychus urticae]